MLAMLLAVVLLFIPIPAFCITAGELAVIVNLRDPLSIQIADYYQQQRRIPQANRIEVAFDPTQTNLPRAEFERLHRQVLQALPAGIQAIALTWAQPYRVDCMSITTAFAAGFDAAFCAQGCKPTRLNGYAGSTSGRPFTDFKIRPTMMLAAQSFADAKALIDRGVAADNTLPFGIFYLMNSPDVSRNVRAIHYDTIRRLYGNTFPVHIEAGAELHNRQQVLLVVTGAATLTGMDSNRFVPGAIADHLTSFGGRLTDSSQTSALAWLKAGATGSYGTVMEPCNLPQKFPNPVVVLERYLRGDTLVEAYWKSVAMPGQGVFIGEPLAAPFRRQ